MWIKSSYSQGNSNCVEIWRKSSHSGPSTGCVEVAVNRVVRVRDSKLGDRSPVLQFTGRAWRVFLAQIKEDS